jgi:hypothetical protein
MTRKVLILGAGGQMGRATLDALWSLLGVT